MSRLVYLDYNATTPVAPSVVEQMLPWLTDRPWNAASTHVGGRAAHAAVEQAREQLAAMVGASPREMVWTSGATEANNLALKGAMRSMPTGTRLLTAATEHKAVLDAARSLEREGYKVEEVPVNKDGLIDLDELESRLGPDVGLVSIMLANNETGVVQPISDISRLVRNAGAVMHTDATQAPGKMEVDLDDLGVDLASFSGHKFYGPKGVGALFVRRGVTLEPLMHGGGHEHGVRSGTSNVPGVVGMGAAAEEVIDRLKTDIAHYERLMTQFISDVQKIGQVEVVTGNAIRLPNTVNIRIRGADADAVMANCPTVMVSSGSACTARVPEPSHVLRAMGLSQDAAYECLRISLGRDTTSDDMSEAAALLTLAASRIRSFAQEVQA